MRRMTEEDENTMTLTFRLAMDDELEKHRMQMTIQWPQLSSGALISEARRQLNTADDIRRRGGDNKTARKHLAHAGNYLAMAYDNMDRQQEAKR